MEQTHRVLDYPHPHLVSFEITKKCNYRCVFCYQANRIQDSSKDVPRSEVVLGETPPHLQPELTVDEIREHIIPQVGEMGFEVFCFVGAEPLLRFDDIIELAPDFKKLKKTLKHVEMGTNGYLLTEEKIDAYCRAYKDFTLTLNIPLDSLDPATVRKLRPPKQDAYERAIAAIELALKKGMYITSGMVVMKDNLREMDSIGKFLKKKGGFHVFQDAYPMFSSGRANEFSELQLSPEELRQYDHYKLMHYGNPVTPWDCMPFPVSDQTWKKVEKHAFTAIISRGCSAGNNYFNIDHAGNVYPCNFLEEYLGNVMDDPHALKTIWESNSVVQKLRNREVGGKCGACMYKNTCGGCRTRAFTETGDMFGGVESCEGGPDGHPLEPIVKKNLLKAYRTNYPAMLAYRFLKKMRLAK
ncbi:MAG TPA: radical SAM protein [Candidatus Lokiarchaeia archaeon]|nr:radical SAM protein [Candidatus Lokiarchaeia archaeon]